MTDLQLPPLETGWLPTTPIGDTYVRRFLLNWAGACGASAQTFAGAIGETPAVHMADAGVPVPFLNCATLLQPLMAETARVTIAEIDAFFAFSQRTRSGGVLLMSVWPTGDLRPYGWRLMGHPPLHLLPAGATPHPAPPELEITEVRDRTALHDWERVAIDGFPLEEVAGAPPGTVVNDAWLAEPRRRLWVGYAAGRPVSASAAWVEDVINNVTLVATLPDARRRGYGEALTWPATLADPALPAMLFSSDDGRPVYERMGYLPLLRMTLWYRPRPG
jgi:GNAT superfamily N-acetyltransferase